MKKPISNVFFAVLLGSCITLSSQETSLPEEPPLSQEEIDSRQKRLQPDEQVIGQVNTTILIGSISNNSDNHEKAYIALLETAKKLFQGDIDIRDIEIDTSGHKWKRAQQCPVSGKVIRR